ncbi:hypothetical protein H9660_11935 [Clostridium sp. Sa3CUN1]|uniref:C2H2-type domain-containing protein n=1 Tax=Clostridium gallinarum TaxID=2762246 RepID=A0ABR8Q647_9CLOT|nr:hypothetical protein [Clostridium gallinarum]MBD7915855.1 hypothetical protein [Clostridium gallinarum]
MIKNKIKEFLNNKRVQAIAGSVAGVLIVTLAGTMILHNKSIENKTVAVEKNTEKENKVEDKNGSVEENKENEDKDVKEQLEELKNTDTSNLSDEEKKELENKIADIESKIANEGTKEESVENNKEVASTTSNSTSNSTSSKNDVVQNNNNNKVQTNNTNNKVENNSTSSNTTESKPNNNVNNNTNNNNTNNNNTVNNTTTNDKHEHTHNWVAITTTVHHDEEGHWENVLVSEAWTEEVPVYEEREVMICNDCGEELSASNAYDHIENHLLNGGKGSWREEWRQVQVGTNKINHEAVYEKKWVVDKAAWDETVVTGYKCSICGETK